jgi:hypothetical protein
MKSDPDIGVRPSAVKIGQFTYEHKASAHESAGHEPHHEAP